MSLRHFLDLADIDSGDLRRMIASAGAMKAARRGQPKGAVDEGAPLDGHILAMIFEKPSTRTRNSFDVGMRQLGGQTIVLEAGSMQLGRGESIADTARVMSRYVDAIMIRANSHADVLELAAAAEVPVINALTDFSHPCQLMADVMTFEEHCGPIAGRTLAWSGDGNNVAVSLIHAAVRFGFRLNLACPDAMAPPAAVMDWAANEGGAVELMTDAKAAVAGADAVITDTWTSMGEAESDNKHAALAPFQVTEDLMAGAASDAVFMHCLPAHRDEEVVASVIDGPRSLVFDEAENRLHAQKAVLRWCLGKE